MAEVLLVQVAWRWPLRVRLKRRYTALTTRMGRALWVTCQQFPASTASSSSLPTSTSLDRRLLQTSLLSVIILYFWLYFNVCSFCTILAHKRRNWTEMINGRVQYRSVQLRRFVRAFTLSWFFCIYYLILLQWSKLCILKAEWQKYLIVHDVSRKLKITFTAMHFRRLFWRCF